MNGRSIVTHLGIGALAFGLGWLLAAPGTAPSSSEIGPDLDLSGEPVAVFGEILRIDDPAHRAVALARFFEATDHSEAPELRELLMDPEADVIVDEIVESLFARWWAEHDPVAAFHAAVNPRWGDRHPWMREVIRVWTRREPIEAAVAVLEIPSGPARGRVEAARMAVDEWLALERMPDPRPILTVIKHLEPIARGGALQHLVETMVEKEGIDATLEFVRNVPPDPDGLVGGSVQHEILARTGIVLLEHDPDRAVDWAREQADGPNGIGVQKHLAYYWGIRDGAAAMEWAMTLPKESVRNAVLKRAWVSFGRKHPDEARAWLHAQRPSEVLRHIYRRHIRTIAEEDPEKALELAERAESEALRQEMRAAAGRGWMKSDPEAATAWLAEAGLPAELEQQVRAAGGQATGGAAARTDGA